MPYTGIDDPSLPSNVKAMPAPARKAWVDTFTGMHDRCMKDGGMEADCEGQAMKMANSAAKRMMVEAETDGADTVELGHLGNLLKWHLDKNKISRGDLAAAMGYADASSIGRLLAGDIMDVSEEKLRAAARLLGVSADELLAAQHRDLVKAGRRQEEMNGPLYTDLANLTPGKPFDALLAGTFTDMYGQEVKISADDLQAIVKNTRKLISDTKTASGELVGLPIDAKSHDKGDAAGWIMDLAVVDGVLQVTPQWTPLGIDKITNGIQRLFSATLDLARKVLLGGTLTNWPAVKGLRAIELSEHPGVYSLQADLATKTEGGDEYPMRCFLSVPDEALPSSWGLRICETVAGAATVTVPQLGRAAAALGPGFRGQKYQPKPGESIDGLKRKLRAEYKKQNVPDSEIPEYLSAPEANSQSIDEDEVIHMDLTEEKLAELIGQQVTKALEGVKPAEKPAGAPEQPANGFDPVKLLEMQGVTDDFVETFKTQYLAQMEEMKKRATQEAEMMLAQERRKGQLTEFAQKVTGGNDETPRGLPIAPDKLKDALLKLPQGQEKFWMDLLTTVQQDGLLDFSEVGHGKIAKGTQPVPKDFTRALRQWVDAGQPVAEFFHLNELGDPALYDLSGYEPKKEK